MADRELIQFRKADRDSNYSLSARLVLIKEHILKVGEVFCHNQCFIVTVAVGAYVTDNFTDVQSSQLEPIEYQ